MNACTRPFFLLLFPTFLFGCASPGNDLPPDARDYAYSNFDEGANLDEMDNIAAGYEWDGTNCSVTLTPELAAVLLRYELAHIDAWESGEETATAVAFYEEEPTVMVFGPDGLGTVTIATLDLWQQVYDATVAAPIPYADVVSCTLAAPDDEESEFVAPDVLYEGVEAGPDLGVVPYWELRELSEDCPREQ